MLRLLTSLLPNVTHFDKQLVIRNGELMYNKLVVSADTLEWSL